MSGRWRLQAECLYWFSLASFLFLEFWGYHVFCFNARVFTVESYLEVSHIKW